MANDPPSIRRSIIHAAIAWIALLALTGATFGMSFVKLGGWSLPIALGFAAAKAIIVALVFMRLITDDDEGSHRLIFLLASVLLALLIVLVSADVATRLPLALPH